MNMRREARLKQRLQKKIYLDNLRIIGKSPYPAYSKRHISFKRIPSILFTLLVFILGYTIYINLISLQQGKISLRFGAEADSTDHLSTLPPHSPIVPLKYLSSMVDPEIPIAKIFGLKVKRIMIDPGHGGSDPGTSGRLGTKEKDVTLDIAMRLKSRLERYNYVVLMTRETDETISLERRVELANSSMADLFISIHLNYLPERPTNIIETYYFGLSSDEDVLRLAEEVNADSPYSLGEFKKILEKVNFTMKFEESYRLADSIQRSLFTNIKRLNRGTMDYGIKRGPFVVLLGSEMPSVLVEVSCLSNKVEEMRLNTWNYREEIASYIEAGILNYLKNKGEVSHEAKRTEEG
jgi:N-acetylmuramoyl-L-alanine amidase